MCPRVFDYIGLSLVTIQIAASILEIIGNLKSTIAESWTLTITIATDGILPCFYWVDLVLSSRK